MDRGKADAVPAQERLADRSGHLLDLFGRRLRRTRGPNVRSRGPARPVAGDGAEGEVAARQVGHVGAGARGVEPRHGSLAALADPRPAPKMPLVPATW